MKKIKIAGSVAALILMCVGVGTAIADEQPRFGVVINRPVPKLSCEISLEITERWHCRSSLAEARKRRDELWDILDAVNRLGRSNATATVRAALQSQYDRENDRIGELFAECGERCSDPVTCGRNLFGYDWANMLTSAQDTASANARMNARFQQ